MEALELDIVASVDAALVGQVRDLVARHDATAGYPGLGDERLRALDRASRVRAPDDPAPGTNGSGMPGTDGARPRVLLGVTARTRGRPGLVGWAQIDGIGDGLLPTLEAVTLPEVGPGDVDAIVDAALSALPDPGGRPLRWWVGHATDADDRRTGARGFSFERELYQMRCLLPLPLSGGGRATPVVSTRSFRVGRDEVGWLRQNNRAFADHPEQGHWDLETLTAREQEPWFDPDGFRVLEVDGDIAGSCWTRVHRSQPPVGEIYVIGVDPEFHGRGWGRALTEDGFAWLASRGLTDGLLYVDASNAAAVALYTSMGMTTHHVDRAYIRQAAPAA